MVERNKGQNFYLSVQASVKQLNCFSKTLCKSAGKEFVLSLIISIEMTEV